MPVDANRRAEPRLTIVFPVYRAEDDVRNVVAAMVRQRPPAGTDPAGWVNAIFIDNASPDGTVERLETELEAARVPFDVVVMRNETNLGLSRSVNRALAAVETDYVLTCHVDCQFASDDYVARAIDLLDRHPDVAVASGQPVADVERGLSRAEKVYLTAYLLDIFPDGEHELEPVGFAEGRCDAFRMSALREVGFYDTTVRRAGEDLVMAARLRRAGYRVCRAPGLRYNLSVSSQQDSLLKLIFHARVLAQVTPYVFFGNRGTLAGVVGPVAGSNRQRRALLRTLQLSGALAWLALVGALVTWHVTLALALTVVLLITNAVKGFLFRRHVRHLRFGLRDYVALVAVQPGLDLSYLYGVVKGFWQFLRPGERAIA